AHPGLRLSASSAPNIHFTVPRKAEVAWLAASGFSRNRLPVQWELLQPMLHDTRADAAARAAIGEPGAFHAAYAAFVTDVLDAHAAAGTRCIIDLHNSARYRDFRFQADGSVRGLILPPQRQLRPWTSDTSQVIDRIFALAPGATLRPEHLADFWSRAALLWSRHPGFGGYGLMNEPHDMPRAGETVASRGGGEDLMIWPACAQAAVDAIRAIDRNGPIYAGGNYWSSAMALPTRNPGWPLRGENIVYEVHVYLDAFNSGRAFDYEIERAKNFSAGFGRGPIHLNTGLDRLRMATGWARSRGVRLALTEVGMPIDDGRWQDMFLRLVGHARAEGCEVYSWMGGSHWPIRNYPINHVAGWHQHRTLEPAVAGALQAAAGISRATLYDDGPGWGPRGLPVTITVYARGTLAAPLQIEVLASDGARLDKTRLLLAAGANTQDRYTVTCAPGRVVTLGYREASGRQLPPPRHVYALEAPVAHAAVDLREAAQALLARWRACKWELSDGHTDYLLGAPARPGQRVRAIADSGFGSSPGNAMEMLNWTNDDNPAAGRMRPPVMRLTRGHRHSDHSAEGCSGFWCKKGEPMPGVLASPRNRVPYNIEDPHFVVAVFSVAGPSTGVVFQASRAEAAWTSELCVAQGRPRARWVDAKGRTLELTGPATLAPHVPVVVSLSSARGSQQLRINGAVVASGAASFAPSLCNQMLMGWGYLVYYPCESFGGQLYAVIAGKGTPGADELEVLERYLAGSAGLRLAAPAVQAAPTAPTDAASAPRKAPVRKPAPRRNSDKKT
ncbi:MAG TPA: cellulase family glycosylhydrolase, partial [Ramlibacter sp.]|nr:cellulase family glycosylhydrolase [Ramlibacter sp.]